MSRQLGRADQAYKLVDRIVDEAHAPVAASAAERIPQAGTAAPMQCDLTIATIEVP